MRYSDNPILTPRDLRPSREGMKIECLLNPGAFRFDGRTWLLVRVAERPEQHDGEISFPMLDAANRMTIMRVPTSSPDLDLSDPRVITYRGADYLTTMSHLRLVSSSDGIQAPENSEATCPAPSAAFHSSDHVVSRVSTSPSSIMRCQNAANRETPSSVSRQTVTVLPSSDVRKGLPPASQTMALKKLASPASAVMYTPISLSFLAAS